jgi:hypothetical protein
MPAYSRKRLELFTIALFLGGSVSAVLFQYHGNEIYTHFDLGSLHRCLSVLLVSAYLLPSLAFYIAIHALNSLLILGRTELTEQKKAILAKLIKAGLSGQVVFTDSGDLLKEVAWASLDRYWRAR